jgi:hypothetical protein
MTVLRDMAMNNNQTIADIGLAVLDNVAQWELLWSFHSFKALKRLCITRTTISLERMEAIVLLCVRSNSLKTLDLSDCWIDEDAFDFLSQALSDIKSVEPALLERIALEEPSTDSLTLGNLRLEKIVFDGVNCHSGATFSHILDGVAKNGFVKCLDLGDGLIQREDDMEKLCNALLTQNQGLRELKMNVYDVNVTTFLDALKVNSSLEVLSVCMFSETACVAFAQGLADLRGLRKLEFCWSGQYYTVDFFKALAQSLEHNTSLMMLSLEQVQWEDDRLKTHLPTIQYWLALNRVGRHLLAVPDVPLGVWALALAKNSHYPNGVFYVLNEKPDMAAPICRKRKSLVE